MMTAVAEPTKTETGVGRVVRVIGPVVDAEFPRDGMPEIFNERHLTGRFEFVPDETGLVFPAGVNAGFFPLQTGEMIEGPMLYDGNNVGVYGAWEADVYAFAYDESHLCVTRMS